MCLAQKPSRMTACKVSVLFACNFASGLPRKKCFRAALPSSRTITRTIFCCTIPSHEQTELVCVVSHRPVYHMLWNRWAADSQRFSATLPSGYSGWILDDRCCIVDALSCSPVGFLTCPESSQSMRSFPRCASLNAVPDAPQNQIESKPAIEAEVLALNLSGRTAKPVWRRLPSPNIS